MEIIKIGKRKYRADKLRDAKKEIPKVEAPVKKKVAGVKKDKGMK